MEGRGMTEGLLHQIIGTAFDRMPEAVQRMHGADGTRETRGISRVMGGANPLSRLIGLVAGMPRPVCRAPVHIRFVKWTTSRRGIVASATAGSRP
jgi:hypothetical protein